MFTRHMKSAQCLVMRGIQTKIIKRFCFITTRRLKIKRWTPLNTGEDVGNPEVSCSPDGDMKWHNHCAAGLAVSQKVKHIPTL